MISNSTGKHIVFIHILDMLLILFAFSAMLITSVTQQFISLCQKCVERIEKLSQQLLIIQHHTGTSLDML